jgi:hypothetical protein
MTICLTYWRTLVLRLEDNRLSHATLGRREVSSGGRRNVSEDVKQGLLQGGRSLIPILGHVILNIRTLDKKNLIR